MLAGNLEYLMTSLPDLKFSNSESFRYAVYTMFHVDNKDEQMTINLSDVLVHEAQKYVSLKQWQYLQTVTLQTIHYEVFQRCRYNKVSQISIFIWQLKQELAAYRKRKQLDSDTANTTDGYIGVLPENPLEAEEHLLKLQWQKLEALSIGHYTDMTALILYKLKLELLLRWWCFDAKKGFKIYTTMLNVA